MVEQLPVKEMVAGSNPASGALGLNCVASAVGFMPEADPSFGGDQPLADNACPPLEGQSRGLFEPEAHPSFGGKEMVEGSRLV